MKTTKTFVIFLITIFSIGVDCKSTDVYKKVFDFDFKSSLQSLKEVITQNRGADAVSSRGLFDFMTDPSLVVTILHTLEVAYWTLPLGFLLMPIINFFRVPNRRNGRLNRRVSANEKENLQIMSKKFYEILKKTLENYENIEKKDIKGFSTQRHLMKKI